MFFGETDLIGKFNAVESAIMVFLLLLTRETFKRSRTQHLHELSLAFICTHCLLTNKRLGEVVGFLGHSHELFFLRLALEV